MLLKQFATERDGNVATMFALALIPILGLVGTAIDYGRAAAARTQMQSAIDATGIMLAKEASKLTAEQLATKGQQYFNAMFKNADLKAPPKITSTATLDTATGMYTVKVLATASSGTTFTRLLGIDQIDIGTSGEVVWGMKRLEIALALDNTGSMSSSNKMTELKKATMSLLNTLYKAAKKQGDVKVAIVPFATDVNIGSANKEASWLDWNSWENSNGKCTTKGNNTKSSCISAGGTWTASNRDIWNGCVWDRNQPNDTNDAAPTTVAAEFEPHQASECPVALLPLTDIYTNNAWVLSDVTASSPTSVLGKKVASMKPAGTTNVTIGVAWGWHALTKSEPLTEASEPKNDLDKVLIVLTDGTNTANRWSSNSSTIDARTKLACSNVKAVGIKVYTIRVIDGNADLLKECATNPGMYYNVQNANQLNAVFNTIAQNLASLRISK